MESPEIHSTSVSCVNAERCLGCLQDVYRCGWIGLDRCVRDVTIRCGSTFGYGLTIRFNEILGFTLHPTSFV